MTSEKVKTTLNGTITLKKWVAYTTLIMFVLTTGALGFTVISDRFVLIKQVEINTGNAVEIKQEIKDMRSTFDTHKEKEGHPVALQRIATLEKAMEKTQEQYAEILRRLPIK